MFTVFNNFHPYRTSFNIKKIESIYFVNWPTNWLTYWNRFFM